MGGLVDSRGVNLFTQFGALPLIYEGDGIAGGYPLKTKGIDKNGKPKDNFTPGVRTARAKVHGRLAEGTRALSPTNWWRKKISPILIRKPSLGIKELWDVQPGPHQSPARGAHAGLANFSGCIYYGGGLA